MGMIKNLTVLGVGDGIAIKDPENNETYIGKVEDVVDFMDEEVYFVKYMDPYDEKIKETSVTVGDIDLIKQKELYYGN